MSDTGKEFTVKLAGRALLTMYEIMDTTNQTAEEILQKALGLYWMGYELNNKEWGLAAFKREHVDSKEEVVLQILKVSYASDKESSDDSKN